MFGATSVKAGKFSLSLDTPSTFVCSLNLDSGLHLNDEAPNGFKIISSNGIQSESMNGSIQDGKIQFNFTATKETVLTVQVNAFVCKGDACSKKTYDVEFIITKGDTSKIEYSLKVDF
eukprot:gene4964-8558_t